MSNVISGQIQQHQRPQPLIMSNFLGHVQNASGFFVF